MRADEIRAAGALLGDTLGGATSVVRQVHAAVGSRVFDTLGPAAARVRLAHDGISTGVYALVRGAQRVLPRAASAGVAVSRTAAATPVAETPLGNRMLGALNGLFGDLVTGRYPPLALAMTVREAGRSVLVTGPAVAAAYPQASSHLVLFVHGLCGTDDSWRWRSGRHGDPEVTMGDRLRDDLGCTPVYLRYNSGLPIWRNGHALATLLADLVDAWPVPVRDLTLIGHSMGGLLLRSACHHAVRQQAGWPSLVRRVITLGTPHLGAPLEAGVHRAGRLLATLPETAPFAQVLRARSAGIKDLRFGALIEQDWGGRHPDQVHDDPCTDVPLLPTARHCVIAVTVTRDVDHPLGRLVGDLLVLPASATGTGCGCRVRRRCRCRCRCRYQRHQRWPQGAVRDRGHRQARRPQPPRPALPSRRLPADQVAGRRGSGLTGQRVDGPAG